MNPKKTKMPQLSIDKYKDMKVINKKFLSQKEGAELYSMGVETFRTLANEANAVYKIGKKVLIKADIEKKIRESMFAQLFTKLKMLEAQDGIKRTIGNLFFINSSQSFTCYFTICSTVILSDETLWIISIFLAELRRLVN